MSISEKVFSRARERTRSIVEFANGVYCTHTIFVGTIHIHVFCKHPSKLEIKSDGDISDGAFYRTSFQVQTLLHKLEKNVPRINIY